jgi:hypothetical protein
MDVTPPWKMDTSPVATSQAGRCHRRCQLMKAIRRDLMPEEFLRLVASAPLPGRNVTILARSRAHGSTYQGEANQSRQREKVITQRR